MESNTERLETFHEGYPDTFGGFFKNQSGRTKKMASFIVNSPPDISPNARVVAVCGISDEYCDSASPSADGWFYSDFFAFHTLLYGQGAAQTWCCADQPGFLLSKYGQYLHGNPFTERRVVLNEHLLQTELNDVQVFPSSSLLSSFLDVLRGEAALAVQLKQPLILLLFGHGDNITKSVKIGGTDFSSDESDIFDTVGTDDELSISTVANIVGEEADVTVISTACFSGGWAVTSILNATVLAAAGQSEESESWAKSSSLSRACGSIYASTLIKSLLKETNDELQPSTPSSSERPDVSSSPTKGRSKTFSEFARTLHRLLLTSVDRFGYTHNISFSAQNDDWESHWRKRTGFPLVDFKSKWESLDVVPPRPSTPLNRDPLAEDSTRMDNTTRESTRGQYGSSSSSYLRGLRRLAKRYLQSFPDADSLAPNSMLHQECVDLLAGKREFKSTHLEIIEATLQFRMSLGFLANQLVVGCSLPLPQVKFCEEWDPENKFSYEREERDRVFERLLGLFPSPLREQGVTGWVKPYWYIVAALMEAGLSPPQLDAKIRQLFEAVHDIKETKADLVRRNPDVQSKRRRLLKSCGVFLRPNYGILVFQCISSLDPFDPAMAVTTASPAEPREEFGSLTLDANELLHHPCLPRVQRLINFAFKRDDGVAVNSDGKRGRFNSPEQIIPWIGKHGRMVILFKYKTKESQQHTNGHTNGTNGYVNGNGATTNGSNGCAGADQERELDTNEPVATAVIKYFKPDLGIQPMEGKLDGDVEKGIGYDSEPADILSIKHWEPACVSVMPFDESLQGKGLAVRCVQMLEKDLLQRLDIAAREQQLKTGQPSDTSPLTFWIRTRTDTTEAYWKRRGYRF
ncbi:uncharacterized protein GIQ15_02903 [Arthroderma uncinatum]|uniref:uncharacterized protein n=1 Tax=Arthroderma uncinatum TaxID=74035 RepID=UPI00144AE5C0|nr:uncharacterized protein GIQ15_02903 [Arthroderma uncinatum]KAF3483579.1 hypothetical protein GIQ15_02903 [Arthroderma uncinatum]